MSSGRRNRLTPAGELVAVPDRGTMWGNRGQLLGRGGELARHHTTRAWIVCVLEFKGWQRTQWQPGRLTELFLLDEATGLAAGHRPCGLCRHAALQAFKAAWGGEPSAPELDAVLHRQRLAPPVPGDPTAGRQRTHEADAATLPDGAMVALDGATWLVLGDRLRRWTPGGYAESRRRPRGSVVVRTPPGTVRALGAGYRAQLHPSA
jgi:hypothetical protein